MERESAIVFLVQDVASSRAEDERRSVFARLSSSRAQLSWIVSRSIAARRPCTAEVSRTPRCQFRQPKSSPGVNMGQRREKFLAAAVFLRETELELEFDSPGAQYSIKYAETVRGQAARCQVLVLDACGLTCRCIIARVVLLFG